MNIIIDIDELRRDLIDYYGTAMNNNPMSVIDLVGVERASDEEIVRIAVNNNFNLYDYEIKDKKHHR